jgi:hypothetical protein
MLEFVTFAFRFFSCTHLCSFARLEVPFENQVVVSSGQSMESVYVYDIEVGATIDIMDHSPDRVQL